MTEINIFGALAFIAAAIAARITVTSSRRLASNENKVKHMLRAYCMLHPELIRLVSRLQNDIIGDPNLLKLELVAVELVEGMPAKEKELLLQGITQPNKNSKKAYLKKLYCFDVSNIKEESLQLQLA